MRFLKSLGTVIKEEHLRSWKDWKFIFSFAFISLTLYFLFKSKILKYLYIYSLKSHNASILYLTVAYYTLTALIPIITVFLAYNVLSTFREKKSLRFIITKIDRKALILGKYFSLLLFMIFSMTVVFIIIYFFLYYNTPDFKVLEVLAIYCYTLSISVVWLAIYILISTISTKSHLALFVSFAVCALLLGLRKFLGVFSPFHFFTKVISADTIFMNSLYLLPLSLIPLFIALVYIEVIDL